MEVILFCKHQRIEVLHESVVALQHIISLITNRSIYVVVDPCNATNGNTYESVGLDLSNTNTDKRQRIYALLKEGSCCSMRHGTVKMTGRIKISNTCAIKWSKMTNKSHGESNTSSRIHNIHAHGLGVLKREGYHLESMSLCILHNAETQASAM